MSEGPSRRHYLQLHLLVLVFASTPLLGKLAEVSTLTLVWWRTLLTAPAALLLAAWWFRRPVWPGGALALRLMGVGAIIALHWMCFFGSIRLSNVSICLAGLATQAFFTAFTEPLFERRRVVGAEVVLGLLVVVGILLVAGFERGHWLGLAVALASALLAAVFPVLNRHLALRRRMDPMVMVGWETAGCWLVATAMLPLFDGAGAYGALLRMRPLDFFWLLLLAWGGTVFAHSFHVHLLRHISAYTSNLAITFEPVYGIIAAALLFGEHRSLHPGFYLGAAAIVAANIAHPLLMRRLRQR